MVRYPEETRRFVLLCPLFHVWRITFSLGSIVDGTLMEGLNCGVGFPATWDDLISTTMVLGFKGFKCPVPGSAARISPPVGDQNMLAHVTISGYAKAQDPIEIYDLNSQFLSSSSVQFQTSISWAIPRQNSNSMIKPKLHNRSNIGGRIHHIGPIRPLIGQTRLRRNHQRERMRVRYVPMKHIHLVHPHRRDHPQDILHRIVIPRRIKHNPSVREHRRVPDLHSHRRARRIPPNQLRERLQASDRAPRRRGREIRRSGGGDREGVGLVDAVVERSGGIGDGDG
ncbi:Beta-hexosaminidase 2 [Senna tora]|uniref:Beta-hexosaminidase 2 n=1 Tax=Senna tora TaxID=362788 RepID=A0A835CEE5_9FABA|nr:Beta-hexosaminidase 2 [Senna tora]